MSDFSFWEDLVRKYYTNVHGMFSELRGIEAYKWHNSAKNRKSITTFLQSCIQQKKNPLLLIEAGFDRAMSLRQPKFAAVSSLKDFLTIDYEKVVSGTESQVEADIRASIAAMPAMTEMAKVMYGNDVSVAQLGSFCDTETGDAVILSYYVNDENLSDEVVFAYLRCPEVYERHALMYVTEQMQKLVTFERLCGG